MAGIASGDAPITIDIIGGLGADITNDSFINDSSDADLITSSRDKLRLGAAPGVVFENSANNLNITAGGNILALKETLGGIVISSPILRQKCLDCDGGIQQNLVGNTQTLSGATVNFPLALPNKSTIIGFAWKNTVAITSGDGATSWIATLTGGAIDEITSGESFALDAKGKLSVVGIDLTATTSINVTPDTGTFSGGELLLFVIYRTIRMIL